MGFSRHHGASSRDLGGLDGLVATMTLLHPIDVAELLGVPVATLANWRSLGKGPPFLRVGRHVRYRAGDVDGWIAAQVRDPEAVTPCQ
jgi:predicted DNA-binding transcriptional regulator AlpA